jgi:carboxymethylenebutenolidase
MNLFQRYLASEFAEDYEEGRLSRREALKLIASVTGSMLAANSILASCAPPPESTATGEPAPTDSPPTEQPSASPTDAPPPMHLPPNRQRRKRLPPARMGQ